MCAAISRSEAAEAISPAAPPRRGADGAAEIGFARRGGVSALSHLYQSDPCRVLFPRVAAGAPPEAVIVTTSGGLVGGDRLRHRAEASEGAAASVTTQAAEKIYRSLGEDVTIAAAIVAGSGAALEWMPQETILFDRTRLRRSTVVEAAADALVLAGEIVVFGRIARGERFRTGLFHDDWRVRRGGRLVWADATRLDGDIAATIARPSAYDGATAAATMIYTGADAAARLDGLRDAIGARDGTVSAGATCLGDVLLARFLSRDAAALRGNYIRAWRHLRAAALGFSDRIPRVWEV